MTWTYRQAWHTPDPFVGARYPIGAMVYGPDGETYWIEAGLQWWPPVSDAVRRRLSSAARKAMLDPVKPDHFGPTVSFGDLCEIPAGIDDPIDWVTWMYRVAP